MSLFQKYPLRGVPLYTVPFTAYQELYLYCKSLVGTRQHCTQLLTSVCTATLLNQSYIVLRYCTAWYILALDISLPQSQELFRPDGPVRHMVVEVDGLLLENITGEVLSVEPSKVMEDYRRRQIPRFR